MGLILLDKCSCLRSSVSSPKFKQLSRLIYHRDMDEIFSEDEQVFPLAMSLFYLPAVIDLSITVPNPAVFQWPAGEPRLDHLTTLEVEVALLGRYTGKRSKRHGEAEYLCKSTSELRLSLETQRDVQRSRFEARSGAPWGF
ncbi:hypothetical protein V2G26_009244 [Clonostachys chloroleuca]